MTAATATRVRSGALRTPGEWRTLAVAAGVYGGWVALLVAHDRLPWWLVAAGLAWTGAWHLSLQHELVHGHPFRDDRANVVLGSIAVTLWVPFRTYRSLHLRHHVADLTDPIDDPESYYVSSRAWDAAGPVWRAVQRANRTLAFRLVVWSVLGTVLFVRDELRAVLRSSPGARRALVEHLLGVAVVVAAVEASGMPWWLYVLGAVYGGRVLNLVRSFPEHRWVPGGERTAMVEAGPVMRLLMLNVNLHLAHHDEPWQPWYRIPEVAARTGAAERAEAGAGRYRGGYAEVVRRYAFRPLDPPCHPNA